MGMGVVGLASKRGRCQLQADKEGKSDQNQKDIEKHGSALMWRQAVRYGK